MLYQLGKGMDLYTGEIVYINGPYEKYGIVWKKLNSGYYLIKGIEGKEKRKGDFQSV